MEVMWNQSKDIWEDLSQFTGETNLQMKADLLINKLQNFASQKDIFGLGDGGEFKGKQTMFKISENIVLTDGKNSYFGNYYGEQTFDPKMTGQNKPHGRGVWLGHDGWIWVQWFDDGKPMNEGKYIWLNTKQSDNQ